MRKFVVTTALALVLAGGAYAQGHHGGGGGGGGGGGRGGPSMMSHGGPGGGGPSPSFSAPRGPSGNKGPSTMGQTRGPSGVYNRSQTMNSYRSGGPENNRLGREGRVGSTEGNQHLFNRYEGREHNNVGVGHNQEFRHGIARGDFFEHGRHFHFRRFWHGEWVFLTGFDDCTAWAWVNVAPGVWAWSPIDVCIG